MASTQVCVVSVRYPRLRRESAIDSSSDRSSSTTRSDPEIMSVLYEGGQKTILEQKSNESGGPHGGSGNVCNDILKSSSELSDPRIQSESVECTSGIIFENDSVSGVWGTYVNVATRQHFLSQMSSFHIKVAIGRYNRQLRNVRADIGSQGISRRFAVV